MQLPGEFSPFIEKKSVFWLVVGGVTPPYTLSGPTTKKINIFLCVSTLTSSILKNKLSNSYLSIYSREVCYEQHSAKKPPTLRQK